jgi:phthiocerol/phenolphthiocerol synthesis type-I polyketide synthase E
MSDNLEEIAIVGMSGAFPGAGDIASLWKLVLEKREGIATLDRSELLASGEPVEKIEDPNYVPRGGFLDDAESFDADFFGLSPAEATVTDPQQRLFMTHSYLALEDAGYAPGDIRGSVGVFAGEGSPQYWLMQSSGLGREALEDFRLMIGNDKDFLATRTSYRLDLRGPSLDIQTACSTSLTAVAIACQSLLTWSCDVALAGGAAVMAPRRRGYVANPGMIHSPTGICRPFDAAADGALFGEGIGVVCLKRLSDAVQDGDYVYAVIKSAAINNDGGEKAGFTAPSVSGQREAIELAQELAGVDPADIGYVETHGTATPLGDPIEVKALTQAFRRKTGKTGYCRLGSIKANIGHLDAAAGIAGLIKTALIVNTGLIPPMRNFETPNPLLELETSPFVINDRVESWGGPGILRLAGVSSFGIGGTNVHAILSGPPIPEPAGSEDGRSERDAASPPLLLSARNAEGLREYRGRVADCIEADPEFSRDDLAAKLAKLHRDGRGFRWGSASRDAAGLVADLRDSAELEAPIEGARAVFAFPGQGSQFSGMAKPYAESFPVFGEWIDRGIAAARELGLHDIDRYLLEAGYDERIAETEIAQPLLFIVEYALAMELIGRGVEPSAVVGHSVGEYAAAAIAGAIGFEAGLRLVARRGYWMQRAPRGAMTAVAAPAEAVRPLLGEGAVISVYNTASQVVASGTLEAVASLEERLGAAGMKYTRLRTSHAFHSPMMDGILDSYLLDVKAVDFAPLRIPMLRNVDGRIAEGRVDWSEYWISQLRQPVRFADCLRTLESMPGTILVEAGPGRALVGFHRASSPSSPSGISLLPGVKADSRYLEKALVASWQKGLAVSWPSVPVRRGKLVLFPGRPLRGDRYWIDASPAAGNVGPAKRAVLMAEGDTAAVIRGAWQRVMGKAPESDDSSFFLAGGDSFAGIQLTAELGRILGIRIGIQDLMLHPNVRELCEFAKKDQSEAKKPSDSFLFPIQTSGSKPPLFLVAGAHENRYIDANGNNSYEEDFFRYFSTMIANLGRDQPLYGFKPKGLSKGEFLHSSVELMAERYIESMKRVQPAGPYWIGGECVGGIVAYEMARRLEERGEEVGDLILLDTPRPGWRISVRENVMRIRSFERAILGLARLARDKGIPALGAELRSSLHKASYRFLPIGRRRREMRRALNGSWAYQSVLFRYHPKGYSGRTTFILNRAWNRRFFLMRWKHELGNRVDLFEVPGQHWTRLSKSGDRIGRILSELIPSLPK